MSERDDRVVDREDGSPGRPASWWDRRSPKHKKSLVMIGITAALLLVMGIMVALDQGGVARKKTPRSAITPDLLTDADPRALGIEGLGQQIQAMRQRNARLETMVDGFAEKQRRLRVEGFQALDRRQIEQKKMLRDLKTEVARLHDELPGAKLETRAPSPEPVKPEPAPAPKPAPAPNKSGHLDIGALFGAPEQSPAPPLAPSSAPIKIRTVSESSSAGSESAGSESAGATVAGGRRGSGAGSPADAGAHVFIPAGSILKGVLITGMDAPTGKQARRDPYPTLIRVKREAILPNRFRADVRECFIVSSGYGSLSSERALIRGESISCVRNDGGVIEVSIDGYAVGEDGKVGMRGRLVSKQGAVLARAMAAGFAKGFGNVFSQQAVPVLSTGTSGGTSPFNQVLSPEALQSGVISGAGDALDRLANFYISMAEEMFPVIEVDAGRSIEFILNHGVDLKLRSS